MSFFIVILYIYRRMFNKLSPLSLGFVIWKIGGSYLMAERLYNADLEEIPLPEGRPFPMPFLLRSVARRSSSLYDEHIYI